MTTFKIHNNSVRDHALCGRLARAGCGCPVPPAVLKAVPGFVFDPAFSLTEAEMFRSYRGVIAAMKDLVPNTGKAALDVLADGVEPKMTPESLTKAMDEYRSKMGLPTPTNRDEVVVELERSIARPEDSVEKFHRIQAENQQKLMVQVAIDMMGKNMAAQIEAAVNKKLEELSAPDPTPKADAPRVKGPAPTPAVAR